MLYSLKLQRDNRQNALAVDPAKGKIGKKAVFSPHHTVEMKQPHTITEPSFIKCLRRIHQACQARFFCPSCCRQDSALHKTSENQDG